MTIDILRLMTINIFRMVVGVKVRTIVKSSQKSTVQHNVILADVLVQNQESVVIFSVQAAVRAPNSLIVW